MAASKLIQAYRDGAASSDAVRTLLSTGDAGAVKVAAVELFTSGLLTEEHRSMLQQRELPDSFRELTEEEWLSVFSIDRGTRDPSNPGPRPPEPEVLAPPFAGIPDARRPAPLDDQGDPPWTCRASDSELGRDLFDHKFAALWSCSQEFINYAWSAFQMGETDEWRDFGYEVPCNGNFPLARTFNALFTLYYASTDNPNCDIVPTDPMRWAGCYSSEEMDNLTITCGGTALATTYSGLEPDPRTELHKRYFWLSSVPQRASTIFHEARHADGWCSHVDGCRAGAGACDTEFGPDGCTGIFSSSGHGAYGYSVIYNMWYAFWARLDYINKSIRDIIVNDANARLESNFEKKTCIRADSEGRTVVLDPC
ncbi:MAG: hypothetical protein ABW321_10420 [Polyangiales bacterium]